MNYHSDEWIMERVKEHYEEALEYFPEDRIVGIFLQGSQNYQMDTEHSDIDTKLIVAPTFEDICFNRQPVSTTHVRKNNEHIDFKDIRLMLQTFRKQNLNFVEILFTKYKIINPMYEEYWNKLVEQNEMIAHYSPYKAVATMKGIALEKYHAMEHPYPSKLAILEKYGYDPKQLHHLVRVDNFQDRFIAGEQYEDCLLPMGEFHKHLMDIKMGQFNLSEARTMAEDTIAHAVKIADQFCAEHPEYEQGWCRDLLQDVSYNIMRIATERELMR